MNWDGDFAKKNLKHNTEIQSQLQVKPQTHLFGEVSTVVVDIITIGEPPPTLYI